MIATTAQIRYINSLREQKAYHMDIARMTRDEFDAQLGGLVDWDAFCAREQAGRDAYTAPLDGITAAQASTIIDALKRW